MLWCATGARLCWCNPIKQDEKKKAVKWQPPSFIAAAEQSIMMTLFFTGNPMLHPILHKFHHAKRSVHSVTVPHTVNHSSSSPYKLMN
jgi:hypothetical protein